MREISWKRKSSPANLNGNLYWEWTVKNRHWHILCYHNSSTFLCLFYSLSPILVLILCNLCASIVSKCKSTSSFHPFTTLFLCLYSLSWYSLYMCVLCVCYVVEHAVRTFRIVFWVRCILVCCFLCLIYFLYFKQKGIYSFGPWLRFLYYAIV